MLNALLGSPLNTANSDGSDLLTDPTGLFGFQPSSAPPSKGLPQPGQTKPSTLTAPANPYVTAGWGDLVTRLKNYQLGEAQGIDLSQPAQQDRQYLWDAARTKLASLNTELAGYQSGISQGMSVSAPTVDRIHVLQLATAALHSLIPPRNLRPRLSPGVPRPRIK